MYEGWSESSRESAVHCIASIDCKEMFSFLQVDGNQNWENVTSGVLAQGAVVTIVADRKHSSTY